MAYWQSFRSSYRVSALVEIEACFNVGTIQYNLQFEVGVSGALVQHRTFGCA